MIDPRLMSLWLAEDIGEKDITTEALIGGSQKARAEVRAKQAGVSCGLDLMGEVASALGFVLEEQHFVTDGQTFAKGQVVASFTGSYAGLLKAERTYLNLVQHLCGVATLTSRYAKTVAHTRAKI